MRFCLAIACDGSRTPGVKNADVGAEGSHPVKVRKANATTVLVSVNHTIAVNKDYTIIAYGSEAQPESIVLTDDNVAPAPARRR